MILTGERSVRIQNAMTDGFEPDESRTVNEASESVSARFTLGEAAPYSRFKCLRRCAGDFPAFLGSDLPTANCDRCRTSIHPVVAAQRVSKTYARGYLFTYLGTRVST